ncbi:hypothetical protein GW626_12175 [Peribacillus muralis]|uniref:hypothetical protein n=1 Tax=Peribacillus muralis TaxID=264697 RepID=UPI001F4E93A6|nr:hypothetical protein [Peribacillus muralis]MCK1991092.1 hypothetical protein [Peribacillus muralis]MCK2011646.1 hypothetical protein [Peribacillus muralis]
MNIREFYQKTSNSNFHASWISLGLAVVFFIGHVINMIPGPILWITAPFIFFSIAQYIIHRIYESRIKELPDDLFGTNADLLDAEHILLKFLPAPTLRLLLFAPDGSLMGEVRDRNMRWFMWMIPNFLSMLLPKRYELVDHEGRLLAKYHIKMGLFNNMSIMNADGGLIGSYQEKRTFVKIEGMIYKEDGTEWMPVHTPGSLTSFEIVTNDGEKIVSYQQGWMPFEWGRRFKANTPILTFSAHVEEIPRFIIIGFCAATLNHHSN